MHKIYIPFAPDAQDAPDFTGIDDGSRCRLPINNQSMDLMQKIMILNFPPRKAS